MKWLSLILRLEDLGVCFVSWVSLVVVVSYPIFLFLLHLTCWLLCLWRLQKNCGRKEGRKIPFKFQLYFGVLMSIPWREEFSWSYWRSRVSQTRRWNIFVIFGGWWVWNLWLCPVDVFVCIYQPLCSGRMWHKVNF